MAAQGTPLQTIATMMKKDDILIPKAYLHQQTGKWGSSYYQRFPTFWKRGTVRNILINRVYMGHMVCLKQTIKSFKHKKLENAPEENWITTPNTHEAIVDEETFWKVQKLLEIKRPVNTINFENIFVGKLKCPDCGKNLGYQGLQGRHKQGNFICNSYRRNTKACTPHYVRYNTLHDLVLKDIREKAHIASQFGGNADGDGVIGEGRNGKVNLKKYIEQLLVEREDADEGNNKKELDKAKARSIELDIIIKRLFEQNTLGVIPDDRFASLFNEYTAEQKALNAKIDTIKAQLDKQNNDAENLEQFFAIIQQHTGIETLTTKIITDLIDYIVIHEHDGGKPRRQKIKITYRFAGSTEIVI